MLETSFGTAQRQLEQPGGLRVGAHAAWTVGLNAARRLGPGGPPLAPGAVITDTGTAGRPQVHRGGYGCATGTNGSPKSFYRYSL